MRRLPLVDFVYIHKETPFSIIIRIRPFLFTQANQVPVQSLVILKLEYCNSLLADLPLSAIQPLQLIQNVGRCVILNLS